MLKLRRRLLIVSKSSAGVSREIKIVSIQVGRPKQLGQSASSDLMEREWISAIGKDPIREPVAVSKTNIVGDEQADLSVHGGVDKAICVYPLEHYSFWQKELEVSLEAGGFGENLTTEGVLEPEIFIGARYRIGTCLVQVTQPRQPCWKLARKHRIKQLPALVQQNGRTGWYFRVLEEGTIDSGQAMVLVDKPELGWSIAKANDVMHHRKKDLEAAAKLAATPGLSESWRISLLRRIEKGRQS